MNFPPPSGNDSSDLGNKSRDDNSTTASSVSTPRTNTNLAAESEQVAETTETTVESKVGGKKPANLSAKA